MATLTARKPSKKAAARVTARKRTTIESPRARPLAGAVEVRQHVQAAAVSVPAPKAPPSVLEDAMSRVYGNTLELVTSLERLEERLAPVLRASGEEVKILHGLSSAESVPLASRIDYVNAAIAGALDRANSITKRLGL